MLMRILTAIVLCGSPLAAQADFETQAPPCSPFPHPCGAAGDPEGVSANVFGAAIVDLGPNGAGFPVSGNQYARVAGIGVQTVPVGGPCTSVSNARKLYIPIPCCAETVSFSWDLYVAGLLNDGMCIDLVAGDCESALVNLAYADTGSALGAGFDAFSFCPIGTVLPEVAPTGPNAVVNAPIPAGARYLRVAVWDGGDGFPFSMGVIDDVTFTFPSTWTLDMTTLQLPSGLLQIDIRQCGGTPGANYITVFTFNQGAYPNGWFFGIDTTITELTTAVNATGPPWRGVLDANGSACTLGEIAPTGIPITIYAVSLHYANNFPPVLISPPASLSF